MKTHDPAIDYGRDDRNNGVFPGHFDMSLAQRYFGWRQKRPFCSTRWVAKNTIPDTKTVGPDYSDDGDE